MCEAYPQRRVEFDAYQCNIVKMSNTFDGLAFYEYHEALSARSASILQNHNIKINWGLKDTNFLCMIVADHTANILPYLHFQSSHNSILLSVESDYSKI